MSGAHVTVLLDAAIDGLAVNPAGRYVDGTYGRGGHARALLAALGDDGRLLVMDRDPGAIEAAQISLGDDPRVTIVHDEFGNLRHHLERLGWCERTDGILLDLGVSSPQLDDPRRGFSFQQAGPLDMRMNPAQGESAADWLAHAEVDEIARVLWEYGEERHARRIARRIDEHRRAARIDDTATLARLIADSVPRPKNNRHPATRSFQAIRIHVNGELEQLQCFLAQAIDLLCIGGRLVIISFHSLEDRLVKRFLRDESTPARPPRGLPLRDDQLDTTVRLRLVGKALRASASETDANPRARSAVLRIAERAA
ncbi:MAG: 16S rRNA (cytosine(1402)-N(4))-methyltransferase RsmH [Gammaproteobacteria bacterium]|nr:16S rRNA (cytosine(1402)-N(4))-methyltransferase RsmH [Gammaproteobacteria bacterium]